VSEASVDPVCLVDGLAAACGPLEVERFPSLTTTCFRLALLCPDTAEIAGVKGMR
jgi:hypothetical protein